MQKAVTISVIVRNALRAEPRTGLLGFYIVYYYLNYKGFDGVSDGRYITIFYWLFEYVPGALLGIICIYTKYALYMLLFLQDA